ncbi:PHD and RING finger domain-containing protein 1 [Spatholobus suberectus]|nr:PHD and RING finger domain-containing protein 1 [Spatholobus suberectus]
MEADFVTNDMLTLTQDAFDANDNDDVAIEGERCGICMDVVIDRGVLDCCQHWFCFVCIDNWATITNLCPLCQNEFQLITCVPVYDTIGNNKVEDDSFFRDDDWSIEGKNNTLSFPSYYIDENAVICLDGDGCKVRNGLATIEGDSGLDTSIACDSCDIWYHAFCVGFDTEGTSDSTWLCPRCVVDEVSKGTSNSIERTTVECNADNSNSECHAEDSFSGKVSVSVADTGETAVVVSMVDRTKWVPATSEKNLLPLEVGGDPMTESCILMSDTNNQQSGEEKTNKLPIMEEEELELSLSNNISCSLTSKSLVHNDLKKSASEARNEPSGFDGIKLFDESHSHIKTSPSRIESDMGLHLGLSVGYFLSDKNETKDQATDVPCLSPEECFSKGDEIEANACKDNARVAGGKRKHADYSNEQVHIKADDGDAKPELPDEVAQKKIKATCSPMSSTNDSADAHLFENAQKNTALKHSSTKAIVTSDIMNIVKGTNRRLSQGLTGTDACDNLSENRGNMAGLRVKKIMKRVSDDGESSMIVQNLRKEIREAVHNKSSINFEDNHFDPKLLEAFRAAITGPKTELVNKLSPAAMKAKKSMLQKGKVREHLTKKIFGTSNGRRKRAWDRDCEIEFWKYRCMRATKPEKVETLKSVLDLLRKGSDSPESKQASECQAKNPILSRLYLADTSVFPRKEDVKPLSVLKTIANSPQTKQNPSEKAPILSVDNSTIKATDLNNLLSKTSACSSEKKIEKTIVHGPVGDNSASGKVRLNNHSERTSVSSAGAKTSTKELGLKSSCMKSDKRKWALEVLARKTAATSRITANGNQEDNAIFKGNYPLLAQLPIDMRPVLASCRHNKIPISVRQTQLYRLTERLLRNTNLAVICRTADTELAVADAINIEKEVADRSNSKLVYLNLCSQELLHRTSNTKTNVATDTSPSTSSAMPTDQQLELNSDELSTDPAVETALKNAGLLSDSPPGSPHENREICNGDISGPDNILELDSHPELDIYGDFEYDLEDEDYIGASVTKVSNPKQEQNESKVKLVFSTMNLKKLDIVDCADSEGSERNEVPGDASCLPNCHNDAVHRDRASTTDTEMGQPSVSSELLPCEGAVEPHDSEFEELYGPDREPFIKKFPDSESRSLHGDGKTETLSVANDCHIDEKHVLDNAVNASELGNGNLTEKVSVPTISDKSSNISETGENIQRKEEKSDVTAKQTESVDHVTKKVEAYIKEHIRPLCKSGVITADQYKWAVAKTTEKVMKYHCKAKNANFLIKEGEKVKKLAEQYAEAAQQNRKN